MNISLRKRPLARWAVLQAGMRLSLLLALAAYGLPAQANEAAEARAETQKLVDTYRACCSAGPTNACRAVDGFFNFGALAKKTVQPLSKVLTPRQRQRLESALRHIYEQTAEGGGQPFCRQAPAFVGHKQRPDGIEVGLEVLEDGEDVPSSFAFLWQQSEGKWLVQDLLVEGGSLITDYQNQFARIRQKEGTSGLLRRVEARLKQPASPGSRPAPKAQL